MPSPLMRLESLESRRLLSAGVQSHMTPDVASSSDGGGDSHGDNHGDDHGDGDHGHHVTRQGPVNGGFEQFPDFTGWQTTGNDLVLAADFYTPPEGTAQGVISNAQFPNGGSTPVAASALETFLGLKSGALSQPGAPAVNGSAIKQDIVARSGDTLTFKADFLTNEPAVGGNGDYAFITLTSEGKTRLVPITAALGATSPLVFIQTGFSRETGYHTYTLKLKESGKYTVGFGVVNVGDSTTSSDLLVDDVQLVPKV